MTLYPFKFVPRFVQKMWGGRALQAVADKRLPGGDELLIGESWELYDFPPGAVGADGRQPGDDPAGWTSSIIANGPLKGERLHSVMLFERAALLGAAQPVDTPSGAQFPLLIKFLDARQDLSVQVHPNAAYAASHEGAALKNECWHVLSHEPGARLLMGAKPGTTREAFEAAVRDGTCESLLNAVPVKLGDTYYLPSGTVHALGAGIVAAEVQTPSDTTYRVFDFNRVDPSTGKPRGLHIEQAVECIDFTTDATKNYVPPSDQDGVVVTQSPQFTLTQRLLKAGEDEPEETAAGGTMRVMMILSGHGTVGTGKGCTEFSRGETLLIPASAKANIVAKADVRWLEATVV